MTWLFERHGWRKALKISFGTTAITRVLAEEAALTEKRMKRGRINDVKDAVEQIS